VRQRLVRHHVVALALGAVLESDEGTLEQPEPLLDAQHAPDRFVEPRHRHFASGHQAGQVLHVEATLHADIGPREKGAPRRLAPVSRETVGDEFLVGGVVGHDEALEVPFLVQHA